MNRYAKAPLPATGIPSKYETHGWTITTVRSPILSSSEIDDATQKLKIPMPEMIFGNNFVELSYCPTSSQSSINHEKNTTEASNDDIKTFPPCKQWKIRFDTLNALDRVDKTGEEQEGGLLKVAYSKEWQASAEETAEECPDEIQGIVKPFDWSYTTDYKGDETVVFSSTRSEQTNNNLNQNLNESNEQLTKSESDQQQKISPTTKSKLLREVFPRTDDQDNLINFEKYGIPFNKLKTPDPILFFDEVVLYEDELGDNGIVSLSIKVRVMAERLLLLSRMFLRVDGVVLRVRDTRVYVEFDYDESSFKSNKTKSSASKKVGNSKNQVKQANPVNPVNPVNQINHPNDPNMDKENKPISSTSLPSPSPPSEKGPALVIREYTESEGSYDFVKAKIPRGTRDYSMYLRDENWVARNLPIKNMTREYCFLSST